MINSNGIILAQDGSEDDKGNDMTIRLMEGTINEQNASIRL